MMGEEAVVVAAAETGVLTSFFSKLGTLTSIIGITKAVYDWTKSGLNAAEVKLAFALNESDLDKVAAAMDHVLEDSGEAGMLIGMYCLKDGITNFPQLYPGPIIVGTGQDAQDALDKYYLAKPKIDEPLPAAQLFTEGEEIKQPKPGSDCFGLWVERGSGPGDRRVTMVPDLIDMNHQAVDKWVTHKSNLLMTKNADAIVALKKTNLQYQEMLEKFHQAAMQKGVYGSIAMLIQENAKAQESFLRAANEVQKALDREKHYRIYSEIGALLGVASSVVNLSNSLAEKSQADGNYYRTVYEQTKIVLKQNQDHITQMFMEQFQVQQNVLPPTDPPNVVKP